MPPPPLSSPCTLAPVLVLGSSILLEVAMPWALWASYWSESQAWRPVPLGWPP